LQFIAQLRYYTFMADNNNMSGFPSLPIPAWVGFWVHIFFIVGQMIVVLTHKLDEAEKAAIIGGASTLQLYMGQQAYYLTPKGNKAEPPPDNAKNVVEAQEIVRDNPQVPPLPKS
jgi:hypothetical protein